MWGWKLRRCGERRLGRRDHQPCPSRCCSSVVRRRASARVSVPVMGDRDCATSVPGRWASSIPTVLRTTARSSIGLGVRWRRPCFSGRSTGRTSSTCPARGSRPAGTSRGAGPEGSRARETGQREVVLGADAFGSGPSSHPSRGSERTTSTDHRFGSPSRGRPSVVATYRPPGTPSGNSTGSPFRGCSPSTIVADT